MTTIDIADISDEILDMNIVKIYERNYDLDSMTMSDKHFLRLLEKEKIRREKKREKTKMITLLRNM